MACDKFSLLERGKPRFINLKFMASHLARQINQKGETRSLLLGLAFISVYINLYLKMS